MKKIILLGLTATAAILTGCSNDELVNAPEKTQSAIAFSNVAIDKATRADDVDNSTIQTKGFKVSGWFISDADSYAGTAILNEESVTYNDAVWGYSNTQYWNAGKDYFFAAYAPTGAAVTDFLADASFDASTPVQGTLAFDNSTGAANVDLVYASTEKITGLASGNGVVSLSFNHLLSRVRFQFENGFKNSLITLKIKDIKVTDAKTSGTVTLSSGDNFGIWTPGDATFEVTFGDIAESIAINNTQQSTPYYFIPVNEDTAYNVTFTIEEYSDGDLIETFEHDVDLTAVTMIAGYNYVYSATIDNTNIDEEGALEEIQFTVNKVEGWDKNSDVTVKTAAK